MIQNSVLVSSCLYLAQGGKIIWWNTYTAVAVGGTTLTFRARARARGESVAEFFVVEAPHTTDNSYYIADKVVGKMELFASFLSAVCGG